MLSFIALTWQIVVVFNHTKATAVDPPIDWLGSVYSAIHRPFLLCYICWISKMPSFPSFIFITFSPVWSRKCFNAFDTDRICVTYIHFRYIYLWIILIWSLLSEYWFVFQFIWNVSVKRLEIYQLNGHSWFIICRDFVGRSHSTIDMSQTKIALDALDNAVT